MNITNERKETQPTEVERFSATESVAKLTGHEINIRFASRDEEPLADGMPMKLDTYLDGRGNEYWLVPETARIVQMGPETGRYLPPETGRKALDLIELRERAVEVATGQVSGFESVMGELHLIEANDRRNVYFFRWEDMSEPLDEMLPPPFMQVGLYQDGTLASFANTISSDEKTGKPNPLKLPLAAVSVICPECENTVTVTAAVIGGGIEEECGCGMRMEFIFAEADGTASVTVITK